MDKLPLEGVRVCDLTWLVAGPVATQMLGVMGAEVIKVGEVNPRFDRMSSQRAPGSDEVQEEKLPAYQFLDRNKKSVALNLKDEKGREIFYHLTKEADVVVDEFRPGVVQRLGVDYDTLSKINPRIIYCSITGYGQTGPYSLLPGHDQNYLAISGILGTTGTADGQFVKPSVNVGDLGGGSMQAIVGILLALLAREKTGRGQYVDIAMTDGLVAWIAARYGAVYFATGRSPKKGERPSHVYETKDGKYICVAPYEPWFWERLLKALDLEEYLPHYRDHMGTYAPKDSKMRNEIIRRMAEAFLTKTRDEWFKILSDADTCVSPTYEDLGEVFSDPHIIARDMIVEVDHPKYGKVRQVGIPIKLSDTPGGIRSLPPYHGEHTAEILLRLGYTEIEIKELLQAGIIK